MGDRAVYIIQPYSHLLPIQRAAKRYSLKLRLVAPAETTHAIVEMRAGYCGLTPLPIVVSESLPLHRGPTVYTVNTSPSVVIDTDRELCDCDIILVTRESVAAYTYTRIAAHILCEKRVRVVYKMDDESEASARVCRLYIGDKGVKIYAKRGGHVLELAKVYKEAVGVDPVFAATAGGGCSRIASILEKIARTRFTIGDVLRAYSRLRVPLPIILKYFDSIRLDYNIELVNRNIEVLHEFKHLINPHPITR